MIELLLKFTCAKCSIIEELLISLDIVKLIDKPK